MPPWAKVLAGIAFAAGLIGLAGFKAYSAKLGPVVQAHGTTYYNGESPFGPVPCKPGSTIRAAITQVHAKYDYLTGAALAAFERRAAALKGLPPLNIEELYVITEDDQLRNGEMVLFIGLRRDCVATVFGLPTKLYEDLTGTSGGATEPSGSGVDASRS